ncbi:MAG: energy-coupling factor ABC transporter ATP-binding protein [Candidatus Methylomirabilales bacterium]
MPFALQNVEVTYGDRKVLTIERLTITPGMITAIMGPNGAGKTTLLKVFAGLLPLAQGSLSYQGETVTAHSVPRLRQNVSLVHQAPLLFDTTVVENVAFGLKARGVPKHEIQQKMTWALSVVGCSDLANRRARELSGGEVKRVAIARALALEPAVLLLDEPLADVDQTTAQALEQIFRGSEARGQTLIFSTHDPRLARRLAQDVVILRQGRLSASSHENPSANHLLVDGETP